MANEFKTRNGVICSPGKFEGEPLWVPYFWEVFLDGDGEDDGEWISFEVTAEDRARFPELENAQRVRLYESEQGFVYGEVIL